MKKNLNVTAAVLDLRKVSEETFASYEDIKLQAALVLTTPRVEALLAKYPVEMEAAALYCNAARAGRRALAICTVSDHLVTGESLSAEERQTSFTEMMELALETAAYLETLPLQAGAENR